MDFFLGWLTIIITTVTYGTPASLCLQTPKKTSTSIELQGMKSGENLKVALQIQVLLTLRMIKTVVLSLMM